MKKQLVLVLLIVKTATGMSASGYLKNKSKGDSTFDCTNIKTNTNYRAPNAGLVCNPYGYTNFAVTPKGATICLCCNGKMINSSFIAKKQNKKYQEYLKKYNISK